MNDVAAFHRSRARIFLHQTFFSSPANHTHTRLLAITIVMNGCVDHWFDGHLDVSTQNTGTFIVTFSEHDHPQTARIAFKK
jgi:hypothetical protein